MIFKKTIGKLLINKIPQYVFIILKVIIFEDKKLR
jgi:hypothetical protein